MMLLYHFIKSINVVRFVVQD